jgi:hypothetical protein
MPVDAGAAPYRDAATIWYDSGRDMIYVGRNQDVSVWHNASAITAPRAPDRVLGIDVINAVITVITGGTTHDILFAIGNGGVYAFDNASTLNGDDLEADRVFRTQNNKGRSLAYDDTRDRLYKTTRPVAAGQNDLEIVENASTVDTYVVSTVVPGLSDWARQPYVLTYLPPQDELLIGLAGEVMLFRNASALDENSVPDETMDPGGLISMGAVRIP